VDQVTATALVVALVVNLVVLVLALTWARRSRRSAPARVPMPVSPSGSRNADGGPWWTDRTDRTGRIGADRPARSPGDPTPDALRTDHPRATEILESLETASSWRSILSLEAARVSRYRRPATVVVADLEGLDRLAARLGPEAVDRLLPAVAGTLRREARSADRVARLANARFGVLLPETDEVAAINWVERVREATDLWLEASAVSLRLAFGWAELGPDADVDTVLGLAHDRLDGERRGLHPNPRAGAPLSRAEPSPGSRARAAAVTSRDGDLGEDSRQTGRAPSGSLAAG
jgi:diguanylate cyclase (GGDEF)-like protein